MGKDKRIGGKIAGKGLAVSQITSNLDTLLMFLWNLMCGGYRSRTCYSLPKLVFETSALPSCPPSTRYILSEVINIQREAWFYYLGVKEDDLPNICECLKCLIGVWVDLHIFLKLSLGNIFQFY